RRVELPALGATVAGDGAHAADAVHVAGDQVAAEAGGRQQCALEVDRVADALAAQGRARQRFGGDVGAEALRVEGDHRQAGAGDGNAFAQAQGIWPRSHAGAAHGCEGDGEAQVAAGVLHGGDAADGLDDAGEHGAQSGTAKRRRRSSPMRRLSSSLRPMRSAMVATSRPSNSGRAPAPSSTGAMYTSSLSTSPARSSVPDRVAPASTWTSLMPRAASRCSTAGRSTPRSPLAGTVACSTCGGRPAGTLASPRVSHSS